MWHKDLSITWNSGTQNKANNTTWQYWNKKTLEVYALVNKTRQRVRFFIVLLSLCVNQQITLVPEVLPHFVGKKRLKVSPKSHLHQSVCALRKYAALSTKRLDFCYWLSILPELKFKNKNEGSPRSSRSNSTLFVPDKSLSEVTIACLIHFSHDCFLFYNDN